jgi:hypothetical protein
VERRIQYGAYAPRKAKKSAIFSDIGDASLRHQWIRDYPQKRKLMGPEPIKLGAIQTVPEIKKGWPNSSLKKKRPQQAADNFGLW